MNSAVTLTRHDGIAVIQIDNPPVNALSTEVIAGLVRTVTEFEADRSFKALVVVCSGRTFVAGGDIANFDDPDFEAKTYNGVLARMEALDRPVIVALHGTVLGGGLELALACHYRVAMRDTRLGFPEVLIGLLPGSLGTQRLPRLVSVDVAIEMMQSGRMINAADALHAGLIDAIRPGSPLDFGIAMAREVIAAGGGVRRTCDRRVDTGNLDVKFFENALENAQARKPMYPALQYIVRCVEAAANSSFEAGEALEARLFEECRHSAQSRAMRHLFFAEREAAKIPSLRKDLTRQTIAKVGVVGAGTMGGGIAMCFANAKIPCVIVEAGGSALDRGIRLVRRNYEASAAKSKITSAQVDERMAMISGSLDYDALFDCDLVIEAVYEDFEVKAQVCARLGRVCKPGAIIATNTSTLDVDTLALASGRPDDFVGMHFFSPANVMRLLEVVRGAKTTPSVLAAVMDIAKRIGKTAVVSGVCYGFIGNRMAEPYMRETEFLLMEGATPAQIDSAVENWQRLGMAMGPCRMLDMAGIDVGAKTIIELGKKGGLPSDPRYRAVVLRLFEQGRHGQKTGNGYYRYEGRRPLPESGTATVCEDLAREHGIVRRDSISDGEIVERLLYPMINEAAKILEEGIAFRPGDIDVIWTSGYGFPDYQGGPMFMADKIGVAKVVQRLNDYASQRGDLHGYWAPAKLLTNLAEKDQRISDWRAS
ncbi:MAG: 3-hydroxyacyl-CoA dehydrogenase NAD-binding domain-containing protein [Burkholderiaceae bacterium]|nr:3-hydroxyacyl-CoA dehydrogenase NAD-binding domain-containing protein [Burkholderiaceae bacterium]